MDALPDEVVVIIGSSLSAVELARFALLSRRFGLDRGEMTTKWKSPTFGFLVEYTAWSSLAEQSARRAVLYRPEFFRSKVSLWSTPPPVEATVTLCITRGIGARHQAVSSPLWKERGSSVRAASSGWKRMLLTGQ